MDAILEATARVLVEEGVERASTNRVALRAGVSVGSLYQYFPNKRALLRALFERHLAEAQALRPAELGAPPDRMPIRERIRRVVEWHLSVHALDPELHGELTRVAPDVLGPEAIQAFERMVQRTVRGVLEAWRGELRPQNLDVAAFLVAQALESLTHAAVVHHPELLDHPELADEMTELLAGYLERPAPAAAPRVE